MKVAEFKQSGKVTANVWYRFTLKFAKSCFSLHGYFLIFVNKYQVDNCLNSFKSFFLSFFFFLKRKYLNSWTEQPGICSVHHTCEKNKLMWCVHKEHNTELLKSVKDISLTSLRLWMHSQYRFCWPGSFACYTSRMKQAYPWPLELVLSWYENLWLPLGM